ncbi:MAG: hypothetical protein AABX37_03515, partial [Nanoarchaeota archaeon]
APSSGSAGGYNGANALCAGYGAGARVCGTEEILESISCGAPAITTAIGNTAALIEAWVNEGPPGYFANANDCIGWTDGTNNSLGAVWRFNGPNLASALDAGYGFITGCGTPLSFACCQ